ncbi:hypothetical protein A3Q56_06548 [Intoshia linei]|uniref:Uncharacterized protein n=1 Tax=Intoshia linei TaxID=1819745 RepID=A0A177AW39_9BILA|nr:hypothetical protein A3Q56_06548 [Intoshia linei]
MSSEKEDFLVNQSNISRSELESKLADLTMRLEDMEMRRGMTLADVRYFQDLCNDAGVKEKAEFGCCRKRRKTKGVLGDAGIKENSFTLAKDIYPEGRDSADKLSKDLCMQRILFGLPRDVAEKLRYTAQDPIKLADRLMSSRRIDQDEDQ